MYQAPTSEFSRRYRPDARVDKAIEFIYSYLEKNHEKCQFSLSELMDAIEGEYQIDRRTVKSRLLEKYEEDILIVETGNKSTVCFKNTGYKILNESWYQNKMPDPKAERMRIVKAAADIILEDIRSEVYNTSEYPLSANILNDVQSVIPESLLSLLETVVLKNKRGPLDKWKKKVEVISHADIAADDPGPSCHHFKQE